MITVLLSLRFKGGRECKSPNEALADEQTLLPPTAIWRTERERPRAKMLTYCACADGVGVVALSFGSKDNQQRPVDGFFGSSRRTDPEDIRLPGASRAS